MLTQNKVLYLTLIGVCTCPVLLSGQDRPDSSCREYREMLQQKGLKIATQPLQETYFPHEVVSVAVSFRNTTDRAMTIPDLDRTSGALVWTIGLETNPSPNFSPETELRGCAFPVVLVLPGESRKFVLGQTDSSDYSKDAVDTSPTAYLRLGGAKAGTRSYRVTLGVVWLQGSYVVQDADIGSLLCVGKMVPAELQREFNTQNALEGNVGRSGTVCRMFSIVSTQDKRYLMSAYPDVPVENYFAVLKNAQAPETKSFSTGLWAAAAVRVAELPSLPQLPKAGADGIVPFDDFQLIFSGQPAWTMADVAQQHAQRQAQLRSGLSKH